MPHTKVRMKKSASRSSSQVSKWSLSLKNSNCRGHTICFFIKGVHARSSRREKSFQPSRKCKYFPLHLTINGSQCTINLADKCFNLCDKSKKSQTFKSGDRGKKRGMWSPTWLKKTSQNHTLKGR